MAGLNGRTGEIVRWILGGVFAALVAYYTAQGAMQERLRAVEVQQEAQFGELQRALGDIKLDVREIRLQLQRASQ